MLVVVHALEGNLRSMTERIFSEPELDTNTSADVMGVTADENMAAGILNIVSVAVEIGLSAGSCR